jgi:acylphosphatase
VYSIRTDQIRTDQIRTDSISADFRSGIHVTAMSEEIRAHVFVTGRVQGVYYRATTREQAREEGVDGWVKNLDDGRVEAVFEGDRASVEAMVEWCRTGSPRARVDDVDVEYGGPSGIEGFEIRR